MGLWTPICHHVQEAGKWVLKPLQVCQVLMEQSCKATKQAMSAQGSGSLRNGAPTLVKAAGLGPQLPLTVCSACCPSGPDKPRPSSGRIQGLPW